MALLSDRHRFLFILNPRTASGALARALSSATDARPFPEAPVLDASGRIAVAAKHGTIRQIREAGLLDDRALAGLFKLVVVRNPYDSLVSLWTKLACNPEYHALLGDPESGSTASPALPRSSGAAPGSASPTGCGRNTGPAPRRAGPSR